MSWQERAACLNDDAREWDEAGTMHAHHVCAVLCRVKAECLAGALTEIPQGQMRANVVFDTPGRRYKKRIDRWTRWKQMHDDGMSYSAIARETGYNHTTVWHAIRKMERAS